MGRLNWVVMEFLQPCSLKYYGWTDLRSAASFVAVSQLNMLGYSVHGGPELFVAEECTSGC